MNPDPNKQKAYAVYTMLLALVITIAIDPWIVRPGIVLNIFHTFSPQNNPQVHLQAVDEESSDAGRFSKFFQVNHHTKLK